MTITDQTFVNWRTADFDFDLPQDLIAQQPLEPRDRARLLHVTPTQLGDRHIFDLPDMLRPGDLLVMNNTRVIPARLYGQRGAVKVEILLHKKITDVSWLAFARPGKRLKPGDRITFAENFSALVDEKNASGDIRLSFLIEGKAPDAASLLQCLQNYGEPPLPPYIKRADKAACQDAARYQTVYAAHDGAVAAPTAGLHFTPDLLARLRSNGVDTAMLTLHVGAGTFLPVKADYIRDHVMHAEWGEIDAVAAAQINAAKQQGRRVIAVGTTSLRLLESAALDTGGIKAFSGDTAIFIYPGYRFKAVDALLTNFHLPQSTLFMLVSAFAGLDRMRAAYEHAIAERYRFYSYGDACFLEP